MLTAYRVEAMPKWDEIDPDSPWAKGQVSEHPEDDRSPLLETKLKWKNRDDLGWYDARANLHDGHTMDIERVPSQQRGTGSRRNFACSCGWKDLAFGANTSTAAYHAWKFHGGHARRGSTKPS